MTTESIFSEPALQRKALVRNLSAFTTLFAPGKSWDNVCSTAAPYTESRLVRLVLNKRVGFPVVEQVVSKLHAHQIRSALTIDHCIAQHRCSDCYGNSFRLFRSFRLPFVSVLRSFQTFLVDHCKLKKKKLKKRKRTHRSLRFTFYPRIC